MENLPTFGDLAGLVFPHFSALLLTNLYNCFCVLKADWQPTQIGGFLSVEHLLH
jgi:hypothetical protein